ncbi:MAG: hypothetical protein ACE145_22005 [Terriglobia bacterium]
MVERKAHQYNIRLTAEEKTLLERRAKKEKMTESDYLRVCMVMDSVISGDVDALKIVGQSLSEKLADRVRALVRQGSLHL